MSNKTPIQELIDWIDKINASIYALSASDSELNMMANFKIKLMKMKQKEKAFAFDCYEAGFSEMWEDDSRTSEEDFDLFYKQYADETI